MSADLSATNSTQSNLTDSEKVHLLLGISGGIAAYKTPDLVRRLREQGFEVRVVMTEAAKAFVTPMVLQAVSGHRIYDDLFDPEAEAAMGHIELARWADVILVAPATANTLAAICHGEANNLLTTLIVASKAPLVVAPAMNQQMWQAEQTQANVSQLTARGVLLIGPASGEQACGEVGAGRLEEPVEIAQQMASRFIAPKPLRGKSLLITAGPTVEAIDPVRFISNHSSGRMGYALAQAAQEAGARVHLVSGPVSISPPDGVEVTSVVSAAEMFAAVKASVASADVFIGCAAVADYTPVEVAAQKIKKNDAEMLLRLQRNPDILAWVAAQENRPMVVGFAAESEKLEAHAQAKLERKKLDLICANDISGQETGFNSNQNKILLLSSDGEKTALSKDSKINLARKIIEKIILRLGV